MKRIFANKIFISALFVVLLFIVFLFLCKPIINYDEDFFVLYTLAGGFGSSPTNILHYYYGWNPFLLWPVAKLFDLYPAFNWYTFFLLILQSVSCTYLLYLFLFMFRKTVALVIFLVFFFFFESQFLQSLNYSNTSFILSLSGSAGFLFYFIDTTRLQKKKLIAPFLLALVGGLLRVHTLGLTVLLSIETGLVLMSFYNFRKFILSWFVLVSILSVFIIAHNHYYQVKIPNSKKEEQFRQSAFYIANHPQIPGNADTGIAQIKNSFIKLGFLYDSSFITNKDLEAYALNKSHTLLSESNLHSILYWTLINNRVYLLLIGIILIFFITSKNTKAFIQWLTILLSILSTFAVLFLFFKVTAGILITIIASIFLASLFLFQKINLNTALQRFVLALLLPACFWMLVRIKKINDEFVRETENTRGMLDELNSHKTILFVFTSEFNNQGFYIWDTPKQRPALNVLNGDLMTTSTYQPILDRFHVDNIMESLPHKSNIIIAGTNLPLLEQYYSSIKGLKVKVTKDDTFKYFSAYRLIVK